MGNGGDPFKPYLNNPMVKKIPKEELDKLRNNPELDKVIISVDWIMNGLRDLFLNTGNTTGVKTNDYSSSIMIARGLLFDDYAHSSTDVDDIIFNVYENTKTGAQKNVINTINKSTIPRLIDLGIVELDKNKDTVLNVMPYPVSSRYYVLKNLLENGEIYNQQINQFTILANIQNFPKPKNALLPKASNPQYFNRDYDALSKIDVIRDKMYNGIQYTVAKDYIMNNKASLDIWKTVLETGSNVRKSFQELLELQGDFGGIVTETDISEELGWNKRQIFRMMRWTGQLGLSKETTMLNWESALIRPISGSKMSFNYTHFNNAQSLLPFCRYTPNSIEIIDKLHTKGTVSEDELLKEFGDESVIRMWKILSAIGLVDKNKISDGQWSIAKNKESEDLLFEIKTLAAKSRRIQEAKGTQKKLSGFAKFLDDKSIDTDAKKLQDDYNKEFKVP